MAPQQDRDFIPVGFAVLAVSDTRGLEDDRSGALLAERIQSAGHHLIERNICVDEVEPIREIVEAWINDKRIDAIVTTGGTGLTGRDITPEAIEPLFEKRMDGFAVLFQHVSVASIGTSAIQSRATAGVANSTFIFCLPGSTGACRDAWDEILRDQFDYRHGPCNFVEILPRLDEHLKRGKLRSAG